MIKQSGKLKAYHVENEDDYEWCSTVVFAETRGQAKVLAQSTNACEDADFIRIRAIRLPEFDKEYRGHSEMDWNDEEDRRALARHGWHCLGVDRKMCATCFVKDDCQDYKAYLEGETDKWGRRILHI